MYGLRRALEIACIVHITSATSMYVSNVLKKSEREKHREREEERTTEDLQRYISVTHHMLELMK
jgi:hypothetical protein